MVLYYSKLSLAPQCIGDTNAQHGQGGNMGTTIISVKDKAELRVIRSCLRELPNSNEYELMADKLSEKFRQLYRHKYKDEHNDKYDTYHYIESCLNSREVTVVCHNYVLNFSSTNEKVEKKLNQPIRETQEKFLYSLEDILNI